MVTSQSQATLQCSPGVMPCWLACLALGSIHTLPTFPPVAHLCLLLYKGSGPPCGAFTALTVTSVYNHICSQRPPQLVCPRPHHSQRPHVFDFRFRREEPCYTFTWQAVCDHRLSDPMKKPRGPSIARDTLLLTSLFSEASAQLRSTVSRRPFLGKPSLPLLCCRLRAVLAVSLPMVHCSFLCATPGADPCWAKALSLPVRPQSRVLSPYCPEMT